MKDIISKVSATTLILIYLFFCGTIYLISYWSTFDLDITNYIEFLDIPKSFVYPFATGIGVSFITILIQATGSLYNKAERDQKVNTKLIPKVKEMSTWQLFVRVILSWQNWLLFVLFISLVFYKPHREWIIAILGTALIIGGVVLFIRNSKIIEAIPDGRLRLLCAVLIFFVPIFSFINGKYNANKIFLNQEYFKISNITYTDNTLPNQDIINSKLLGKLGSNLFVSDSANSNVVVLNLATVKLIEFKLKK